MKRKLEKNWLEWVCFSLSVLLVAGVVGYLSYDAWTTTEAPAQVSFHFDSPQARDGQFVVRVIARNDGDQTAEGVRVEVRLTTGGQEERAEFVIDYLPRHGTREGYVTFNHDPAVPGANLRARAMGYTRP